MPSKTDSTLDLSLPSALAGGGPDHAVEIIQRDVLHLFDECGGGLRRYVASFGLTVEATDDIVQEVFLQLSRHLQLGRSRRNLRGWVFQVGHNLALKHREKAARRRRTESEWDGTLEDLVVDPSGTPEELLADDRRGRRLRAVVEALPERDRRCLYLRAAGLRYREIAKTLGVSLGSVAKSLTRALRRLAIADEG